MLNAVLLSVMVFKVMVHSIVKKHIKTKVVATKKKWFFKNFLTKNLKYKLILSFCKKIFKYPGLIAIKKFLAYFTHFCNKLECFTLKEFCHKV